ncbi:preprotein translocase subunit SecG [Candidatus Omnitrophota bacterium]
MMSVIIGIHIIACIGLIFFILIQSGRGGGLIESFTSSESLLGTKTNAFIAKTTTGFAITFFITCLVLAFLSVQQGKSIVEREIMKQPLQPIGEFETTPEATQVSEEVSATIDETFQEVEEIVDKDIPKVIEETIDDTLPEQSQTVEQTQENNAATQEAAAIQ